MRSGKFSRAAKNLAIFRAGRRSSWYNPGHPAVPSTTTHERESVCCLPVRLWVLAGSTDNSLRCVLVLFSCHTTRCVGVAWCLGGPNGTAQHLPHLREVVSVACEFFFLWVGNVHNRFGMYWCFSCATRLETVRLCWGGVVSGRSKRGRSTPHTCAKWCVLPAS